MTGSDREPRERRLAKNEALFRELNERLEEDLRGEQDADGFGFVCECADGACAEPIWLSLFDYERLRANPLRFVVLPGHELPAIEEIVEERDGYLFVKKTGTGGAIAAEKDPRRR
ncbi:MAG: hypothetical protein M3238_04000 [Actinomycetota bacterium]|nr:hypothetical protein [Actinomycetota bacterium]